MPKRTKLNEDLKALYGFNPSTIEDIDRSIFNYINDDLNVFCETNEGFIKVPVMFSSPERAFQLKDDQTNAHRIAGRVLKYPLMSIIRSSMTKNPQNKGQYGVYIPPYYDFYSKGGSIPIARQVMQEKTRDRANATAIKRFGDGNNNTYKTFPFDNSKVVYETLYVPMPTYIEVEYQVSMVSEYQQQMNQIMTPFLSRVSTPAVFNIEHNGHVYEAFIDPSFGNESNNAALDVNERVFKTTATIKVLGYLLGDDKNQETPVVSVRESAAEVKIARERVVTQDEPEFHAFRKDKYRR
jgi:hypothetical protein